MTIWQLGGLSLISGSNLAIGSWNRPISLIRKLLNGSSSLAILQTIGALNYLESLVCFVDNRFNSDGEVKLFTNGQNSNDQRHKTWVFVSGQFSEIRLED